MTQKQFVWVRAGGAIVCIVTLNAMLFMSFQDPAMDTPRWSVYVLLLLIGALLGLDALVDVVPNGGGSNGDG